MLASAPCTKPKGGDSFTIDNASLTIGHESTVSVIGPGLLLKI
jgi:hypothetical protein